MMGMWPSRRGTSASHRLLRVVKFHETSYELFHRETMKETSPWRPRSLGSFCCCARPRSSCRTSGGEKSDMCLTRSCDILYSACSACGELRNLLSVSPRSRIVPMGAQRSAMTYGDALRCQMTEKRPAGPETPPAACSSSFGTLGIQGNVIYFVFYVARMRRYIPDPQARYARLQLSWEMAAGKPSKAEPGQRG